MTQEQLKALKKQCGTINKNETENKFFEVFNRCIKSLPHEKRTGLHGSDVAKTASEICWRECWFAVNGYEPEEPEVDEALIRIFATGTAIHEKWQKAFVNYGLCMSKDIECRMYDEETKVSYTPDAIVTVDKEKYIVEIKSMNTYPFRQCEKHDKAYVQAQMYMRLSGIHKAIVLCEDKNTNEIKVFYYKYDPEVTEEVYEKLKEVVHSEVIPDRCSEDIYSKKCRECKFFRDCWKEYET